MDGHPPAPEGAQTCRVCGCWEYSPCYTEDRAECYWIEDDLCSHCEGKGDPGWDSRAPEVYYYWLGVLFGVGLQVLLPL